MSTSATSDHSVELPFNGSRGKCGHVGTQAANRTRTNHGQSEDIGHHGHHIPHSACEVR